MQRIYVLCVLLLTLLSACQPVKPTIANNASAPNSSFTQYQSGEAVVRGTPLQFPADHGAHPKQSIEWWYLTGNLTARTGETFGVQWTLFRARLPDDPATRSLTPNPWWQEQFYFAHFALQSDTTHRAFERFGRAGQVQIQAAPFRASLDDWALYSTNTETDTLLPMQLSTRTSGKNVGFGVELSLDSSPIVAHGDAGYSQKTPDGNASYYYSLPFLQAQGTLTFAGQTHRVSGSAWLDREWSGGLLSQDFIGWDWFSLQASPANKNQRSGIMAFCLRGTDHSYRYCDATRITQSLEQPHRIRSEVIPQQDIRLSVTQRTTLDNRSYPIKWQLSLGKGEHNQYHITAINPDSRNQLIFPYWEGRVTFKQAGTTADGSALQGRGYAELTGY